METTQWCLGQNKPSKHVWYMLYPFSRRNTLRTVTEKSWSHQPVAEALLLNLIWGCMIEVAISLYALDNIQQKRWTSQVGVYLFSHLLILEETISMQSYEAS